MNMNQRLGGPFWTRTRDLSLMSNDIFHESFPFLMSIVSNAQKDVSIVIR